MTEPCIVRQLRAGFFGTTSVADLALADHERDELDLVLYLASLDDIGLADAIEVLADGSYSQDVEQLLRLVALRRLVTS